MRCKIVHQSIMLINFQFKRFENLEEDQEKKMFFNQLTMFEKKVMGFECNREIFDWTSWKKGEKFGKAYYKSKALIKKISKE